METGFLSALFTRWTSRPEGPACHNNGPMTRHPKNPTSKTVILHGSNAEVISTTFAVTSPTATEERMHCLLSLLQMALPFSP